MRGRGVVGWVHLAAGVIGFLTILSFWISTAISELSGDVAMIAAVKGAILWGMILLVPAMMAVGATGLRLARGSAAPLVRAKQRRMPIIAGNGLLVLVPSAVFLAGRATEGRFDATFVAIQALELLAGGINIVLMALNIRDGLALSGRYARALRS
ncbi:MAG: hypothetical protein IT557_00620 [Alphaproteobacteria bacterium]|nr:hypothetical protein [Alphaproteobacteria bacterium]